MADPSANKALIKIGSSNITHYSSALVRRAVEDIAKISPGLLLPVSKKSRLLLIASMEDAIGSFLKDILQAEGFIVNVVECYGHLDEVYFELSSKEYDLVIPTNNSLRPRDILKLVPGIKLRFPTKRIVVISSYGSSDFILTLKQDGIDDFFPLPIEIDDLVLRIRELIYHQR